MTITNRLKITLTPLRLHSASSVRIPNSINNFRTLIPALRLRPLNLLSASSVNLHGLANTNIFHNNLRVMLSPLKSPVLRKYSNPFKRPGMYPSTGLSRYVDFAYLDTTTNIEVIFHSQHFFSVYFFAFQLRLCRKTVNMKQRVSRVNFSCPRRIFYYICYCLCRNKNRRSHGRQIVSFGYVHVLAEV